MKIALAIGFIIGVPLTLFAYRMSQLLSPDAIAMAIGMFLGVGSLIPTLWLVSAGRARDEEDEIVYQPQVIVYRQDVTPLTNVFRDVTGMQQLPDKNQQTVDATVRYLNGEVEWDLIRR